MISRVPCAALLGIEAFRVDLETDFSRQGLPAFTMVGLAEGAVRESKERVFSALKNTGFKLPPARITVNLAPADMRKEGSGYDLPLAVGLLAAAGIISPNTGEESPFPGLERLFLVGELSLNGDLKPVSGILPTALTARESGASGIILPAANAPEAAVVEGLSVYAAENLSQVVGFLTGREMIAPYEADVSEEWNRRERFSVDFGEVKGQEHAKRAVEIAAAGAHNLLFIGPPGSGKTMLARRIPTVLPPLSFDEALEVTKIYSVVGLLKPGQSLIAVRPFRAPHHTVSDAGLVGGGQYPKPGEISLAHRGVLFLDELPEFKKHVLEVLRQPLEDGEVTISRAAISLRYPADLMLVSAMNPCRCGYLGDQQHQCTCTPMQIQSYRSRLSGPLLDRIDLHIEVPAVPYKDLKESKAGTDSETMRTNILKAREIQSKRYQGSPILTNSSLTGRSLEQFCPLGDQEHAFLEKAVTRLALSARAYTRILRIARTIADLAATDRIQTDHLAEAVNLRVLDREGV